MVRAVGNKTVAELRMYTQCSLIFENHSFTRLKSDSGKISGTCNNGLQPSSQEITRGRTDHFRNILAHPKITRLLLLTYSFKPRSVYL